MYVDDKNLCAKIIDIKRDVEWTENGDLLWVDKNVDETGITEADREKHTANVIKKIADKLMPTSLKFEVDVPSNYEDNLLPILDLKKGKNNGKLEFYFYSKPMTSQNVIHRRSAITSRQKLNILVEEGYRRLRNYSPSIPWNKKVEALNRLMIQMFQAEHTKGFRRTVVAKYKTTLDNHIGGGRIQEIE